MNDNTFGMELHFHDDLSSRNLVKETQVIFMLEGAAQITIEQDAYKLSKDDVIVVNPGQSFNWTQSDNTLVCIISISDELIYRETNGYDVYFWCNSAADSGNDYKRLKKVIGSLLSEYSLEMDQLTLKKRALFYQLLDYLLNYFVLEKNSNIIISDDNTLSVVIRYIQEHYREQIPLSTSAGLAYMNESAFSRYFKKKTGINYLEYVNSIRLRNALEELLHTEKSIVDIALDNGFTNSSMFSKTFRKTYGMSPTEYKNSRKQSSAVTVHAQTEADDDRYRDRLAQLVKENFNREKPGVFQYNISIDTKNPVPFKKVWTQCVNVGSARGILQAKMQKCLCEIHEKLGTQYIRINNIFSWEMRIRKDRKSDKLNFELLDEVVDFLLNNGMKPFINLSQKPNRVLINTSNIIPLERTDSVFETLREFKWIFEEYIMHAVRRYGLREVETWIFDVGLNPMSLIDDQYFEGFDAVCKVVKNLMPSAKVGGCCVPVKFIQKDVIDQWFNEHCRPDFISIVAFPYSLPEESAEHDLPLKHSTDFHFLDREIRIVKNILKECAVEDTPVVLAEWNLSFSDRSFYNDSCGKAAQLLMNMTECLQEVDSAAYIYAADLSITNYDTDAVLFGGTGMMSKDGIAKPVFYAHQFMSRLAGELIEYGDRYIVTADAAGSYSIILFNYKQYHYNYYMKPENEIRLADVPGLFSDNEPIEINLELTGLENGLYHIKTETIGVESGDILSAWGDLNYEKNLDRKEIQYLKQISIPRIRIRDQAAVHNTLVITELLNAHDIRLIYIYR